MNDFLSKMGAVARHTANTVSTDLSIAAHEQRAREAYQALGKLYYNYVSSGLAPEGKVFDEKMEKIAGELKRIKELRSQKSTL